MAEERVLALDYERGPHRLSMSITERFAVRDIRFQTSRPLVPEQVLRLILDVLAERQGEVLAFINARNDGDDP